MQGVDAQRQFPCGLSRCLSEASGVERRSRIATAISKMPLKGKSVPPSARRRDP